MSDLFASQTQAYFVTRDNKDKIRCVNTYYDNNDNIYYIHRITYQYGGKQTEQPIITIDAGKVNRDTHAQCILRFLAICKEYKDKGYKEIDSPAETLSIEDLNTIIGEYKTDSSGIYKPMLAKQASKVTNTKIFDKVWVASRKIDGVRCLTFWDGKHIKTSSRGGGNYDYATEELRSNKNFIKLFQTNPELILDGELYKHGWPLQKISGAARLEKNAVDCDQLEYYVYDYISLTKTFKERLKVLNKIKQILNLKFDPTREWAKGELKVQMVPQVAIKGWDNIINLHNQYVEEGWEGVVIRDPNRVYKPGGRTNDMIKVKMYKDSEFLVKDYELGLRGSEDIVFICETPTGKLFKAKPMGTREDKKEYIRDFNSKYKNHLATVKYFYYSNGDDTINGVPLQPCLKTFRDLDDL